MRLWERIKKFLFPAPGSPAWLLILPYGVLGLLTVLLLAGGVSAWEYSNSPKFCGTACHTMPPENAVYQLSPHANVTCEECHIGRASIGDELMRKSQGIKETWDTIFHLYTLPIHAQALRPARETCETCHQPEAFSDDSMEQIVRYASDRDNTATTTYLILKTGGGAKRQGLGKGIHWHIVNEVQYYATDDLSQNIPYVRVKNDDGTTTEYVDVQSGFDPKSIDPGKLKAMDCLTCHNRVTHNFMPPAESVDLAMCRGLNRPGNPGYPSQGGGGPELPSTRRAIRPPGRSMSWTDTTELDLHGPRGQDHRGHPDDPGYLRSHRVPGSEDRLDDISQQPGSHQLARLFPLP